MKEFDIKETHYYKDRTVEIGRRWKSIIDIDLYFINIEVKYPTWKKWKKTKYKVDNNKAYKDGDKGNMYDS